jgi:multiple sugar transport system substrate-binding protein
MTKHVSRRSFIKLAGAGAVGGLLASCAPPATPEVEIREVTKIVEGTPQTVQETVIVEVTPPPPEPQKLTVVITGEGEDLRENTQPFIEEHPEIEVEIIGVAWDGYDEKVDLMIAGGEPPAVWYPAGARTYTYYAERDLLVDIMPYVERESFALTDFYESALEPLYWQGKLLGLPAANFIIFLTYNKTLFDSAGVPHLPSSWKDESWNWDSFVSTAQALTEPTEDPMETIWGFGGGFDYRYALLHFGADYWEEEAYHTGKPAKSLVTSEPAMAAYQIMQDLIWKHEVEPSPEMMAAYGEATNSTFFLSSRAGMSTGATWSLSSTLASITDFEWGIAPFPVNEWNGPRTILYAGNWLMFEQEDETVQDAGWELLKFFVSPVAIRKQLELEQAGRPGGVTQGGIPGRVSLGSEWAQLIADASGLTVDVIEDVVVNGVEYSHIFPSQATGKWGEVSDVAIQPELDKILLNETTVAEAVQAMDQKITEILSSP